MISFRLTEDEFEKCRELCFTQGMRSVSEMARTGIHLLLQQPSRAPQEALESRVSELEGRVHLIALDLKKLSHAAGAKRSSAISAAASDVPEIIGD